ncbi:MAG: hypothetical protein E7380_06315 [Clostridiales bacterium]|nr:hypothetical protein [Clostridiales bacterium]
MTKDVERVFDKGLHSIAYTLLGVFLARIFLCSTFFEMPAFVIKTFTYSLVALTGAALAFALPKLIKNKLLVALWVLLFAALFASYFHHGSALEYIRNTFLLLGVLTILPYVRMKERTMWIFIGAFLLYVLLLAIFVNRSKESAAFIQMNTNDSSFVCFLAEVLLLCLGERFSDWRKKLSFFLLALGTLVLHIFLGGRSTLIGSVLFLGFFLLKRLFSRVNKSAVFFIVAAVFAFGVFFAYFFSEVLYDWVGGYGQLTILGKDIFTGRQRIWQDAFEQINGDWLLGLGYSFVTFYRQGDVDKRGWNLHNQPMGYLIGFGVIAFLLYTLLLSLLTAKAGKGRKLTVGFMIALIVNTYFDTSLFSTSRVMYLPIAIFILYQIDWRKEEEKCPITSIREKISVSEEGKIDLKTTEGEKMKLHYCWVGGAEKSEKIKNCIESWKRVCPSAEIIEWNEENYDVNKNAYIRQAYEQKKYAFVSDYMRFDILYRFGGVYLDTDVELLKDITPLTKNNFTGFESEKNVAPGLILCAKAGNPLMKEIVEYYDNQTAFSIDKTVVQIMTEILQKHGLKQDGSLQTVADFVIYPTEYFNPKGGEYGKDKITENTYSIHHYEASWKSPLDQKIMRYKVKYGNKKGRILFALRHPLLTLQKRKEKKQKSN